MKKILIVTHTASMGGGAERVLNTLVGELSKEFRIDVIERIEDNMSPFVPQNANICHLPSMSKTDRLAAATGSSIFIQRIWRLFLSILIFIAPKVVHKYFIHNKYDYEISFNYLYPSYLVANSPNKNSSKLMWIHGNIYDLCEPSYGLRGLKLTAMKIMQRKAFLKTDVIVAISKRTYDSILRFVPQLKSKLRIIYNGYDLQGIREKSKHLNLERGQFSLVSIGRLEKLKNFELQIIAVSQLVKDGLDVKLYILGDGNLINDLKYKSGDLLNKNIFFEGYQNNPYPYISSTDALLITSMSEGFPTVAVEAMALGKPVISTPVAGTDELINPNTGVIIDWNLESVVNGIKRVLENPLDPCYIQNFISKYSKEVWMENIKSCLYNTVKK